MTISDTADFRLPGHQITIACAKICIIMRFYLGGIADAASNNFCGALGAAV